nr:hypothetical protein [Gammaproteobacteria bacterium]
MPLVLRLVKGKRMSGELFVATTVVIRRATQRQLASLRACSNLMGSLFIMPVVFPTRAGERDTRSLDNEPIFLARVAK